MRRPGLEPAPLDCRSSVLPLHHDAKVQRIALEVSLYKQSTSLASSLCVLLTFRYSNLPRNPPGPLQRSIHTQGKTWGLTSPAGHGSHIIGERSSRRVSYPVINQYEKGCYQRHLYSAWYRLLLIGGAYPSSSHINPTTFSEKEVAPAGTRTLTSRLPV